MPINAAYTIEKDDPIYESIAWKTYKTGFYVAAIMVVGIISFTLILWFSRYRYARYLRKKVIVAKQKQGDLESEQPRVESDREVSEPMPNVPSERT